MNSNMFWYKLGESGVWVGACKGTFVLNASILHSMKADVANFPVLCNLWLNKSIIKITRVGFVSKLIITFHIKYNYLS